MRKMYLPLFRLTSLIVSPRKHPKRCRSGSDCCSNTWAKVGILSCDCHVIITWKSGAPLLSCFSYCIKPWCVKSWEMEPGNGAWGMEPGNGPGLVKLTVVSQSTYIAGLRLTRIRVGRLRLAIIHYYLHRNRSIFPCVAVCWVTLGNLPCYF